MLRFAFSNARRSGAAFGKIKFIYLFRHRKSLAHTDRFDGNACHFHDVQELRPVGCPYREKLPHLFVQGTDTSVFTVVRAKNAS